MLHSIIRLKPQIIRDFYKIICSCGDSLQYKEPQNNLHKTNSAAHNVLQIIVDNDHFQLAGWHKRRPEPGLVWFC